MATIKTKVFAHRGSKGTHPENTLPAFEEAVDCLAEGIELDVHLSRDGQLIVMHDEKVDRTTDGQGRIADLTLAQLKELDGGSWFSEKFAGTKIPTLPEVTSFLQEKAYRGTLNIEIKTDVIQYEGIEQKVNDWMESRQWSFTYLYSSFHFPSLEKLALIAPDTQRAFIMFAEEELIQLGVYSPIISGLHPKYTWIEKQSPNVSDFPKDLRPWTVNKKEQMIDCFNKKLTAIHTDYPQKALEVRKEWQNKYGG
ncbi:glycerophosphodiester phosphodiesterase [Vagococcus elongatus]|uniref:Glycerophosphodiester phosphodiesterase n=1 Tax=Vagococcus elongatus TaxID=180344 RepID=A0A430ARP3_9ENTE|nr:glycerophosphodiester phosphodiesterase [Vagococcus elongatus]RSU10725.1 glycerophosphodiester phosphodiesterase [Vagococcus elongatus]